MTFIMHFDDTECLDEYNKFKFKRFKLYVCTKILIEINYNGAHWRYWENNWNF